MISFTFHSWLLVCFLAKGNESCHITKTHCSRGGIVVETSDLHFRSLGKVEENVVAVLTTYAIVWWKNFLLALLRSDCCNYVKSCLCAVTCTLMLTLFLQYKRWLWEGLIIRMYVVALCINKCILTEAFVLWLQVERVMPTNLLALAVGIKQKNIVNEIIQKVCFSLSIMWIKM